MWVVRNAAPSCLLKKDGLINMRLIVSDMDGTLLNEFWRISEENKQAILAAQARGIEFVIATGRPYTNAAVIVEEAGITCPIISLNGAETYDQKGKLLERKPVDKKVAKEIIQIMQDEDIYVEMLTNVGAISINYDRCMEISHHMGREHFPDLSDEERNDIVMRMFEERVRNERTQFVQSFAPYFADDDIVILKFFSLSISEEHIERARKRLEAMSGLSITSSTAGNLEVNHEDGHKGFAVMQYAKSRGISPEEVMTIGDGYNDLTMLRWAGRGVVMGNAPETLRVQCKYGTKRNTEHGVAHAIDEMLAALVTSTK